MPLPLNSNKRIAILGYLLLAALLVLLMVGCSSTPEESAAPAPAPVPAPAEPAPYDPPVPAPDYSAPDALDQIYLTAVREVAPEASVIPDDSLLNLAQSICDLLAAGGTKEQIFLASQTAGVDAGLAGAITGAAVITYCPQYRVEIGL